MNFVPEGSVQIPQRVREGYYSGVARIPASPELVSGSRGSVKVCVKEYVNRSWNTEMNSVQAGPGSTVSYQRIFIRVKNLIHTAIEKK